MTVEIAVISDVHSNLEALKRVLREVRSADMLVCCGDIVGYGPRPVECVDIVRERCDRCVMGNHDYGVVTGDVAYFNIAARIAVEWTRRQLDEDRREFLAKLPKTERFEVEGVSFFLVHGSPRDPIWEYVFPHTPRQLLEKLVDKAGTDVLIMGHTHVPMYDEVNGSYVLNPGSVGQPRDGDPRAAFGILEVSNGRVVSWDVHRVAYNVDRTAREIEERGLPEELGARLYRGV
ncbi:metallophosphoesterase family protein [Methanopyrus kandleri]